MKKHILVTVIIIASVCGGSFFVGIKYQQSKANIPTFSRQFFSGRQGGRPIIGEILNQDEHSLTVKLQDGSSKIVILSEKTMFNKLSEGSRSDLKTNEKITAFGIENSDGSITAQNISIGGRMFQRVQRGND